MKYATVGKENRKVYRVEAAEPKEVVSIVDGEEEISVEFIIPTASSHREIIEISDEEAEFFHTTDGEGIACCWKIIGGTLQNAQIPD